MSYKIFDNSLFSGVFNKNDYFVEAWSRNVFNKIKNSKIIPSYIPRVLKNYEVSIFQDNYNEYQDNDGFTYGRGIVLDSSIPLSIHKDIVWGKRFDLSFEADFSNFETENGFLTFFSNDAQFTFGINYNLGDFSFKFFDEEVSVSGYNNNKVYTVRVLRNFSNYKVFLDGNQVVDYDLSDQNLPESNLNGPAYFIEAFNSGLSRVVISNLKVLNYENTEIINWWRFNLDKDNEFFDVGVNSYDFYSFFYPIIRFFAYIVRFSKYFGQQEVDENFIRRFLTSKGINYPIDYNYEQLLNLFNNWKNILSERSTMSINRPQDLNKNYSLHNKTSNLIDVNLSSIVNLGGEFILEFTLYISNGYSTYRLFDDQVIITPNAGMSVTGVTTFIFQINIGGDLIYTTGDVTKTEGFVHFKFYNLFTDSELYINGELYDRSLSTYSKPDPPPDLKFEKLIGDFSNNHRISFLDIVYFDGEDKHGIRYNFDQRDNLFIPTTKFDFEFEARIFENSGIFEEDIDMSVYYSSNQYDEIDNKLYKTFDGELLLLFNKQEDTELVLAKATTFDLSWVLGSVSPDNKQTYPILWFNKLPNKKPLIDTLKGIPYIPQFTNGPSFNDITIEEGRIKISRIGQYEAQKLFSANQNYCSDWIVEANSNLSYEVSFRMDITSLSPNFQLTFGVPGASTKSVKTDVDSIFFLNDYNITREGEYWFRGIIFGKDVDITDKEKGLSFNIEGSSHLQFNGSIENPVISLELILENNIPTQPLIYFYDFQVRLLNINSTKVSLGAKNVLFLYGQNNTFLSNDEIKERALNLIPYDSNLKLL